VVRSLSLGKGRRAGSARRWCVIFAGMAKDGPNGKGRSTGAGGRLSSLFPLQKISREVFIKNLPAKGFSMEAKLRTADVVFAIDAAPALPAKTFQQWLDRGQIKPENGYGGGWAEFTLRDVANFAITWTLVDLANIEVGQAFKYAADTIQVGLDDLKSEERFKRPGQQFYQGWDVMVALMARDKKKNSKRWKFWRLPRNGRLEGSGIVIDVYAIVKPAIERALARLQAKQDDIEPQPHRKIARG
jgi:hypothetical protein